MTSVDRTLIPHMEEWVKPRGPVVNSVNVGGRAHTFSVQDGRVGIFPALSFKLISPKGDLYASTRTHYLSRALTSGFMVQGPPKLTLLTKGKPTASFDVRLECSKTSDVQFATVTIAVEYTDKAATFTVTAAVRG